MNETAIPRPIVELEDLQLCAAHVPPLFYNPCTFTDVLAVPNSIASATTEDGTDLDEWYVTVPNKWGHPVTTDGYHGLWVDGVVILHLAGRLVLNQAGVYAERWDGAYIVHGDPANVCPDPMCLTCATMTD